MKKDYYEEIRYWESKYNILLARIIQKMVEQLDNRKEDVYFHREWDLLRGLIIDE
jgi:hypothetical protein